jgi:hypothetical protein
MDTSLVTYITLVCEWITHRYRAHRDVRFENTERTGGRSDREISQRSQGVVPCYHHMVSIS